MRPMNVPAKLEVRIALPLRELIGGTQKLGLSLAMPTLGEAIEGRSWYRSKKRW